MLCSQDGADESFDHAGGLALAAGLLGAFAEPAMGQPQNTSAEAEKLFRDGKALMAAGDYARACEAFAGSARKDPVPTTMANLADCREKNQQYASAWGDFLEAARLSRNQPALDSLRKMAEERAAALEPRLSYLIVNVADEARVEGLVIMRNGEPVDSASWNRDIPVDGGTYTIAGKAPAYEPWSTTVKVGAAGDKQSVNVPRFAVVTTGAGEPGDEVPAASMFTGKRKLAIGAWAVGAIGLGAGLALELKSGGTYEDAEAADTNDRRHELTDRANRERLFATIAAGIGVAAVGVGIYLWLDGKPRPRDRVAVHPVIVDGGLGAALAGSF